MRLRGCATFGMLNVEEVRGSNCSGVNLGVIYLSTNGSELGRMFVRREDWMNGRSAMRKSNSKHT